MPISDSPSASNQHYEKCTKPSQEKSRYPSFRLTSEHIMAVSGRQANRNSSAYFFRIFELLCHGMMAFQWNEAGNMGKKVFFFRARGFRIKGYWSHVLEPNEKPSISESFEVLYFVQKVFFVHSFTKKRIYRDLWWDKVKYKCEVLVFKHTPEISFRHGACQLRFTSAFGQECGKCAGLGSLNAQVREGSHTKFQLSCTLQFILSRSYNVFIMIMRILAMPAASTYQLSSQSVCPSAFNFFLGSMPS